MPFKSPMIFAATLGVVMAAGNLSAKPALRDVQHITAGLITVGIAYEISETCSSINARFFRGISYLNSLKSHARGLGYTDAEIDAYTDDKAEQNRLEGIARARLFNLGAISGQPETYCAVGRAQMDAGTAIGRLLR